MADIEPYPLTRILADRLRLAGHDSRRLEHYGFKVFSQSDEDGIIEEIFRRIGTACRVFVDFGAESGEENNSRYLLEQGWTGLWIEAFPASAESLRQIHSARIRSRQLKFVEAAVTAENINELIHSAGIEGEIDFLSVDIDGNDYHVFEAISVIQPRVICLEYNPTHPPPEDWVMPYDPNHRWSGNSTVYGASVVALERLALSKGYLLVGCSLYSPNAYFVRQDLVNAELFSGPFSAAQFFHEISYEDIIRFPRDEARHQLILREEELAEARAQILKHAARAEKALEKNGKLQLKIAGLRAKLEKPPRRPWWRKIFHR